MITKRIEFHLQSPIKCTHDQFEEWVRYSFGLDATVINESNPLLGYDLAGNINDLTIDGHEID